jgi:hypothetical protein
MIASVQSTSRASLPIFTTHNFRRFRRRNFFPASIFFVFFKPGTDANIKKIFSLENLAKILAFLTLLNYAKIGSQHWFLRKTPFISP